MENVIKFDKNFGKPKTREDMNFDKITLYDDGGRELAADERKKYLDILYGCMESRENQTTDVMIGFDYETVEKFFEVCQNKVCATTYCGDTGKDLFDGLDNIRSFHILCLLEGSADSKIDDILFMNKPFVSDLSLGVKLNSELKSGFIVTAFYAPAAKKQL